MTFVNDEKTKEMVKKAGFNIKYYQINYTLQGGTDKNKKTEILVLNY